MTTFSTAPDNHTSADVVVVGAGIFGCAIAFALANQGRSVTLLERWLRHPEDGSLLEPDRIVGELLQPGGVTLLNQLGLGHCLEDIDAIPCRGYTIMFHDKEHIIHYPELDLDGAVANPWNPVTLSTDDSLDNTPPYINGTAATVAAAAATPAVNGDATTKPKTGRDLFFFGTGKNANRPEGRSFHHGRFIRQLRKSCEAHKNITLVETEATAPIRDDNDSERIVGVRTVTRNRKLGTKQDHYFLGDLTIVADGYASTFRKSLFPQLQPVVRSKFYALELIDCDMPHPKLGHVIISPEASPVLIYQIGTHETRALIDVPANLAAASSAAGGVRGYIRNTVIPILPPQLRPSFLAALDKDPDRIPASMPNSYMPAQKQNLPGLLLLGDAANMRHPLTGGGMTVAFGDAVVLADLLHPSHIPKFTNTRAVQAAAATLYWRRKQLAGNINVLAQALYSLFAADDRALRALQHGCIEYFRRGITDGPAGLLAGVIRRPRVLVYHFFAVAFVAIGQHSRRLLAGDDGTYKQAVAKAAGSKANGVGKCTPPPPPCEAPSLLTAVVKTPAIVADTVLILWTACVVFLPVLWRELM